METFSELIKSGKPVLVDFYAGWCRPCKAMEPIVKDVAKTLDGKLRIIKVDIDRSVQAARAYGVQAVPTLILFKKGNILWRHPGMIGKTNLLSVLAKYT